MPELLRDRLRAALKDAMRARDDVARDALRAALGTIDNAEAVAVPDDGPKFDGPIAGAVSGLGAAEVPRLELTEDQIAELVRHEVDERRATADVVALGGQEAAAARLLAEADLLEALL